MIQQLLRHIAPLKIPENAFRQSRDRGGNGATQPHGNVFAGKHHLVDALEYGRLVIFNPCQFGGSEVAGRVEQMVQAKLFAQSVKRFGTIGHSTRIAPDDSRAQHLLMLIDTYQAVHLVRDANGGNVAACHAGLLQQLLRHNASVVPPVGGILFGPATLWRVDGGLVRWIKRLRHTLATLGIYQTALDR